MNHPLTFHSIALAGLDVHPVTVRAERVAGSRNEGPLTVDVRSPSTDLSSHDAAACVLRVGSALAQAMPVDASLQVRVTVECAVAPGTAIDLAVACAVAHALGAAELAPLAEHVLFGELSLTGRIREPRGLACVVRYMSAASPARTIVASDKGLGEAKLLGVPGVVVVGVSTLGDLLQSKSPAHPGTDAAALPPVRHARHIIESSLSQIPSGVTARALLVAAAGEHGVFLAAERWSAPAACARALASAMPTMTDAEWLDVACARSTRGTDYSIRSRATGICRFDVRAALARKSPERTLRMRPSRVYARAHHARPRRARPRHSSRPLPRGARLRPGGDPVPVGLLRGA